MKSSTTLLINPEMKMFLLLLISALANAATGQPVQCPGPYHAIGNGCYIFPEIYVSSWTTAHLFCEFSGGYLVKIDSATEQMDLEAYHNEYIYNGTSYYRIGATDMLGDGTWRWAPSGETLDYEYWGPYDPIPSDIYSCAVWITGFYWAMSDCCTLYEEYYPLCEADPL